MQFQISTWVIVLVILSFIGLLGLIPNYYRAKTERSGVSLRKKLILYGLRFLVVLTILFALLDPYTVERKEDVEDMEVCVLIDSSLSMTLKDEDGRSRWDAAKEHLEKIRPDLKKRYNLRIYTYGDDLKLLNDIPTEAKAKNSDLSKALKTLLERGDQGQVDAIIVFSDGKISNQDKLSEVAGELRSLRIPVYTIPYGTVDEDPDVVLKTASLKQLMPFEPELQLTAKIDSSGFKNRETIFSVRQENRLLLEKSVSLSGGEQILQFPLKTPYGGFTSYKVNLSVIDGERLKDNNQLEVGAEVIPQKIRVLYMEGTASDTECLPRELSKDPMIEVTTLFITQRAASIRGEKRTEMALQDYLGLPSQQTSSSEIIYNVTHPEKGAPKTLKEMLKYDVVIMSDILKEAFSEEQLKAMVHLVEKEGGGFVMVGGITAFGAGNFDETIIDRILPVEVYGTRDIGWQRFNVIPKDPEFNHPIMQVGETIEETRNAWQKFPGFSGCNIVNRPKPGAYILAENSVLKNEFGKLVVWAVQSIGRGRSMAFTPDTTNAWGSKFQSNWGNSEDKLKYYRKFWNNSIRWLAADRIARKSNLWSIQADEQGFVGTEIPIEVKLPEGMNNAGIILKVSGPDGQIKELPLVEGDKGMLVASMNANKPGNWTLTARRVTEQGPVFVKHLVYIMDDNRELESTRARPDHLESLSKKTNGVFLLKEDMSSWKSILPNIGTKTISYEKRTLWDRSAVLFLVLILLGTEWFCRRLWGFA